MMTKSRIPIALAAAVLWGTVIALGQSTESKDLGVGKLLVSSRGLSDPNFAESVVLLIHYDKQGTVGLMINRRTKATVSRVIDNMDTGKHGADPIYVGGPVGMTSVFGLFRSRKKPDDGTTVLSEVYLVSTKSLLAKTLTATPGPSDLRLYLGYCGWAPRQLENEVQRGGWWIFDARAGVVFDSNPASVWSRFIAQTERQMVENRNSTIRRGGLSQPTGIAR
ncbi:MAG TPA: YqgE/AlgH family protein [Terriglobia bacterium]|nr:YqgE/AlgH family protein [Terriglobia bacterium]